VRLPLIGAVALLVLPLTVDAQQGPFAPYTAACADSMYVALKRGPVDSLSAREYALFAERDRLCLQSRAAPAPSTTTPHIEYKDAATGTLFALFLTGGGHFYAGEPRRGALLLGGSVASVIAGAALSQFDDDCWPCKRDVRPFQIGIATSVGLWLYGVFDAHRAADRENDRRYFRYSALPAAEPLLESSPSGATRVGLRLVNRF
jgi:hypothetical protein